MRNVFLLLLVSVVAGCSGGDEGDMPPVDAGGTVPPDVFAAVQDQVITPQGWSEEVVRIYGMEMPLQPGQTVGPAFDVDGNELAPMTVTEPTWFFWADLTPFQFFSHGTVFIYLDEDGSNLRVEQQQWFPLIDGLVFMPDVPTWGPADLDAVAGGSTTAPYRTMRGQPCGEAHAVVVQGWDTPWITATVDRLVMTLAGRGYQVHRVTPVEEPRPDFRAVQTLNRELTALTMGEQKSQVDIFYVGHGNPQGEWVFGADEQGVAKVSSSLLLETLQDPATARINVIIDSCHAAAFATPPGRQSMAEYVAGTDAADTFIRVLASSGADEKSSVTAGGAEFTERLMTLLATQPAGQPFDYDGAMVAPFTVTARDDSGLDITLRQTPAAPYVTTPSAPLLFVDREFDECQVVANLPWDEFNERRVTIRGAGFGDAEGTVDLFRWETPLGVLPPVPMPDSAGPVALPIFSWSDQAIVVQVPMRSEGFPGDPDNLQAYLSSFSWERVTPQGYGVGAYYVRVSTVAGAQSAAYQLPQDPDGTWIPPEHFYAPQLIHVDAQIREQTWTPDFSGYPVGIEYNEMWLQMIEASPELGTATILVSHLRANTDPLPVLTAGGLPSFYYTARGSEPHTTGPAALARHMGRWSYDLPAAERDLGTAMDTRLPTVNFWGFRQQFEDLSGTMTEYLIEAGAWEFLLVYD